jgi:hypothetical protein
LADIEEGTMNEKKSTKLRMIAVAVVASGILAAASQAPVAFVSQGPKPGKICPITFILEPMTSLQETFARDTEEANANLAVILVELRKGAPIPGLAQRCAKEFALTYLAYPVLWTEAGAPVPLREFDGKAYERWEKILDYLKTMVLGKAQATYVHPQSVRAYLEYLPLERQTASYMAAKSVNLKGTPPGDVDFLVNIRTVLAYAPYDDPLIIGNESAIPHRKVCEPIY